MPKAVIIRSASFWLSAFSPVTLRTGSSPSVRTMYWSTSASSPSVSKTYFAPLPWTELTRPISSV